MQLIEGEVLSEKQVEDMNEVISIAIQLCDALDHAHEKGIIHRDIKPSNVVQTSSGTTKLMDFGIARSPKSDLTQEGAFVGTVDYIAPEQAMGREIDHKVDLYALGVMLYQLAAGRLPFEAENPAIVLTHHLHEPVVPPREHNPEIPLELEKLILHLMNKKPENRPASAKEVAQMLVQIAEGKLIAEIPSVDLIENSLNNLPVPTTSFIGRERELSEIGQLIEDPSHRLVTLVGPGGVGKTRLAIEAAAQQGHAYPDGVFFVPLTTVSSSEYLVSSIADLLQFTFDTQSSNLDPSSQLLD
jgi:serine/threonine protein kinase